MIYSGARDVIGQFVADDIERRPHGQCRSVPKINAEIFELCAQGLVERPADAGESMHGLISLTRYVIEYAQAVAHDNYAEIISTVSRVEF
jgi:hypothetical protein